MFKATKVDLTTTGEIPDDEVAGDQAVCKVGVRQGGEHVDGIATGQSQGCGITKVQQDIAAVQSIVNPVR